MYHNIDKAKSFQRGRAYVGYSRGIWWINKNPSCKYWTAQRQGKPSDTQPNRIDGYTLREISEQLESMNTNEVTT